MIPAAAGAELAQLRIDVETVDRAILELMIERADIARRIWEHKLGLGIALIDPAREVELLDELRTANGGRLSAEGLADLHVALLAITRRELERRPDSL